MNFASIFHEKTTFIWMPMEGDYMKFRPLSKPPWQLQPEVVQGIFCYLFGSALSQIEMNCRSDYCVFNIICKARAIKQIGLLSPSNPWTAIIKVESPSARKVW